MISALAMAMTAAWLVVNPAKSQEIHVESPESACRAAAARQEAAHGLPGQLLAAIALSESGRWDPEKRESFAWPWTVTSGGEGRYYPTKQAAITEVVRLMGAGVSNIDVGCMQVNLGYHGDAFASLDQAFDPDINAAYAATFLNRLYDAEGDWKKAVAAYHSRTPHLGQRYQAKVVRHWNDERERAGAPPVGENEAGAVRLAAAENLRGQQATLGAAQARERLNREREVQQAALSEERARAKATADAWRAEKLKAYLAAKEARNRADGEG